MLKLFSVLILILSFCVNSYSAEIEIISEFSDETLPVQNENIRQLNNDFLDLETTAATITANVNINIASITTVEATTTTIRADVNALAGAQSIDAWVRFDGTAGVGAITPDDSYNVSAVSKSDTGIYTITWDTDFANTNYCLVGTAGDGTATLKVVNPVTLRTTSTLVETVKQDTTKQDCEIVCIMAISSD